MRMLKQWMAALLSLCLLCPAVNALAVDAVLNQRMATRSGPGTKYTEELGTFPQSTQITVIEQVANSETTWVLVEFRSGGSLYRAYTGLKRVNAAGSIPWGSTAWYADTVTGAGAAYYGPGYQYARRAAAVYAGQTVYVYETEGQWALCEYTENGKNVRAYLPVTALQSTAPGQSSYQPPTQPPITAVPSFGAVTIVSQPQPACVDYYGKAFDYTGHSVDYARLVSQLPVMESLNGSSGVQSAAVYTGPGYGYWRPAASADANIGAGDTALRVYGTESGWAMVRYTGGTGPRFGWIAASLLPAALQQWAWEVTFAPVTVVAKAATTATAGPENYYNTDSLAVPQGTRMTALAFLDQSRAWIYCEYSVSSGGRMYACRGFLPADDLRIE